MLRYVPSGRMKSGAFGALLLTTLAAALVVGGVLHVVGNWIRLLVIFPLAMGLGVGWLIAFVVKRKAVRAPLLAASLALFGGLLAWGFDMGLGYVEGRGDVRRQVEEIGADLKTPPTKETIHGAVNAVLARWGDGEQMDRNEVLVFLVGEPLELDDGTVVELPRTVGDAEAAVAWVRYQAGLGTTISRSGRDGMELGRTGTYVLWLLELLLAGGVAAFLAWGAAREPYCETCGSWYDTAHETLAIAGAADRRALVSALERDDAAAVVELASDADAKAWLLVRARRCPQCAEAPRYVEAVHVARRGRKANERTFAKGLVPAEVCRRIAEGVAAKLEATEKPVPEETPAV